MASLPEETGKSIMPQKQLRLSAGGHRSALLIAKAYKEEGLECPDIDEQRAPIKLLYPRSFVDAVSKMPGDKINDYCFVGVLYSLDVYRHRKWIIDFAAHRFTDRSYLLITDRTENHTRLGPFDYTNIERDIFVAKEAPGHLKAFFHDHFFRKLRSSQFTLCPAGDAPWSMRFFEAIMCRSIPIVSDVKHMGRNDLERSIGYRVYLPDANHVYDEDLAEENFQAFLRHQTLIKTR